MEKKITESKGFNIVLALLIAVALWVYVTGTINPDSSQPINNVKVTILNEEVLESRGLMVVSSAELTVNIRIRGSLSAVHKIVDNQDKIYANVDVSNIKEVGTYELTCGIRLPDTLTSGQVTVENPDSYKITLAVENIAKKSIGVVGVFTGTVPEGYRYEEFSFTPSTIEIQGPEQVIRQIDHAQVAVSNVQLTETYTGEVPFTYVDAEGKAVEARGVVAGTGTVNAVLPVVMTAELPLSVEFTPGGGATEDNVVSCTIEPATISISGAAEDVEAAMQGKSLVIGTIDLSRVDESGEYPFDIVLDPKLNNDSGVSSAKVKVELGGLVTRTFETSNIEIINRPEGRTATAVTQSIQVKVRGTEEQLATVSAYQLRVVVDLKDQQNLPLAQYRYPVHQIYLDNNSGAGVVWAAAQDGTSNSAYAVVVSVS